MRANSFVSIPMPEVEGAPPARETVRYDQFVLQLAKPESADRMKFHAALGVCGEAGELADAIKNELTYGKGLNRENIVEELGDLRWYIQLFMNLYDISEDEILQHNAEKLCKRYHKLKYTDQQAQDRADKSGE